MINFSILSNNIDLYLQKCELNRLPGALDTDKDLQYYFNIHFIKTEVVDTIDQWFNFY